VAIEIASSSGSYSIEIGNGLLDRELAQSGDCLFIIDSFLAPRFAALGIDAITLTAEEETKSLDQMSALIEAIKQRGCTRQTTLIGVGGGVVQDCVTFAASIYMRGVPWVYVPTTLLSMVDSCIGGKSSINVGPFKNIVGTFHPPQRVMIDPLLAETLDAEARAAGLCEAVKICICRGPEVFDAYIALDAKPQGSTESFAAITELCLSAKKWFIEIDEFDRKERLILNFGHTFGHAIEAASHFAISHGIAVGLGMLAALRLGEELGLTQWSDPCVQAFEAHVRGLVASVQGVVDALRSCQIDEMMQAFSSDKKHSRSELAVILLGASGSVERIMLPRNEATLAQVAGVFDRLKTEI
jgi:3-dehydroquinate synthase